MRKRAKCVFCDYSMPLRKNGFPERHYVYAGNGRWACPGGEMSRTHADVPRYPVATFLEDKWRRMADERIAAI